jgi:hypothetical protein
MISSPAFRNAGQSRPYCRRVFRIRRSLPHGHVLVFVVDAVKVVAFYRKAKGVVFAIVGGKNRLFRVEFRSKRLAI